MSSMKQLLTRVAVSCSTMPTELGSLVSLEQLYVSLLIALYRSLQLGY